MSDDVVDSLRGALRKREPFVLVVVPPGRLRDLLSETQSDGSFAHDLSIEQYKAKHEPDLSLSRIRELCVSGAFPDTTDEAGVTPGAYKNAKGEWRITLAGIVERQRQERLNGMERRDREAELRKEKNAAAESKISKEDPDGPDQDDEVETDGGEPSTEGPRSVDRPGKDRWMAVLAEKGEP